ncbi:hypothetical protein E5D57_000217 [Metarhizium anisopliae]|uniref:Uncharacterized protein n=1 Tax=Metarhizium guizhouense (strain ARSEF 977) TaxID=1276136 RepID=A0A0B4H1X5_METGA|nr:hypothetical protein E5D57_000217 [Metarhizium anisopliae]KID85987.1 hypothetical protein MGU_06904 [Metarhizium guizhouense ARSEF 977]
MAPITCKVVDANNRGRPGVYVVLECKDQLHRGIATLESLTDEDGGISLWFPTPSPGRTDDVEPQIVDSSNIPRVSLTFFPHTVPSTCPGPFLSIHTDLYLQGDECHGITLYLDPHPRLEHSPVPVASPLNKFAAAAVSTQEPQQDLSTPSPLLLPPPVSQNSRPSPMLLNGMHCHNGSRGQKRKAEDYPQSPNKRR